VVFPGNQRLSRFRGWQAVVLFSRYGRPGGLAWRAEHRRQDAGATAPVLVEIDVTHGRRGVGSSLTRLKSSSNFFSSTLPCDFCASTCLRKTSSRRASSPFSLTTSAAKSQSVWASRDGMGNDGARFGIDPESRLAAGALHVEHTFGHATMVRDGARL